MKPPYQDTDNSWKFLWEKNLKTLKQNLPVNGNESKEHRLLKAVACLFILQYWGLKYNDKRVLFENQSEYIRPDISIEKTPTNLRVAFEVGDLSFRDKIKSLIDKDQFDVVVWIPYYNSDQLYYLAEVEFMYMSIISATNPNAFPFIGGAGYIVTANLNSELYYLTWEEVDHNKPSDIIKAYIFSKKPNKTD